ncbi:MAG: prephenate dehydrogenase [Eubacteriales bacterium]|nr:prephenate dehydrogenase [Eubacteriales bacterium]
MIVDINKNILIVGLGLMGGSYAKGLKRYGFHISAITKDQSSIDYAIKEEIIDEGTISIDKEMIRKADIIIFALYPHILIEWIKENQKYFKTGALITDVTGVKTSIIYDIQNILRDDVEYIAAHPMAGREVYGVENSTTKIFNNANYIVTPTKKNTKDAIVSCMEIGQLLGFENVSILTPEEHDDMVGFVSQLTHCIAISLMTCNESEHIEKYTGDSFRDLTRIARINDEMWSELFLLNKNSLIKNIDIFLNELQNFRNMLYNNDVDGMREKMKKSTIRRALFDKKD